MSANKQGLARLALESEVLRKAVLSPDDMCSLNFAREEHYKLEKIQLTIVIPALGGCENELACDIARHVDQIRTFSRNFCWRLRHLGASFGVVGKRPGIDDLKSRGAQ